MGDYQDCVDLPFESSYFKSNFINNKTKLSAQMYTGLCLPSQCTGDYVKEVLNRELANSSAIIQQLLGFPIAVGTVEVNPQNITYDISGWFYTSIILFALLFIIGVFASLRSSKNKK